MSPDALLQTFPDMAALNLQVILLEWQSHLLRGKDICAHLASPQRSMYVTYWVVKNSAADST